jgi:hypothetical protein
LGRKSSKFKVQGFREELELGMGLAPEGRFVCRKEGELPQSIEPWKGDLFEMGRHY